jgi:hypothetical protein
MIAAIDPPTAPGTSKLPPKILLCVFCKRQADATCSYVTDKIKKCGVPLCDFHSFAWQGGIVCPKHVIELAEPYVV